MHGWGVGRGYLGGCGLDLDGLLDGLLADEVRHLLKLPRHVHALHLENSLRPPAAGACSGDRRVGGRRSRRGGGFCLISGMCRWWRRGDSFLWRGRRGPPRRRISSVSALYFFFFERALRILVFVWDTLPIRVHEMDDQWTSSTSPGKASV